MAAPTISELPITPQRLSSPEVFNAAMDAFLAAFPTLRTEINAFIEWLGENSTIIGGALNATTLGLTTPAAAKFTEMSVEGKFKVSTDGDVMIGTETDVVTSGSGGQEGFYYDAIVGYFAFARDGGEVANFNRLTSTGQVARWRYNGSVVGSVSTDGTNTAYNTSSDYRLKTPVDVPAEFSASDKVLALADALRWYSWNADPEKVEMGWFAHELQAIEPRAVTGEKDAVEEDGEPVYQGRDDSKLIPVLVSALADALHEIEDLKIRVTALES